MTHTHLIFISKKVFFEFLFSSFNLDDELSSEALLIFWLDMRSATHIFSNTKKKLCTISIILAFFRQNEIGLLITQKTNFWSFDRLKPWDRNSQAWNEYPEAEREGGKKNHFLNHKNFACSIFKNRLCCCFFLTINSSSLHRVSFKTKTLTHYFNGFLNRFEFENMIGYIIDYYFFGSGHQIKY